MIAPVRPAARLVFATALLLGSVAGAGKPRSDAEIDRALVQRNTSAYARDSLVEAMLSLRATQLRGGLRRVTPAGVDYQPARLGPYAVYFAAKGPVAVRKNHIQPLDPKGLIVGPDAWTYPGVKPPAFAKTGCPLALAAGAPPTPHVSPSRTGTIILAAAGNLDDDATYDCWSISNVVRQAADGTEVPANRPYHEQSDWDPALLEGVPELEVVLEAQLEAVAVAIGNAWHVGELLPESMEEVLEITPDAVVPEQDPWGHPYQVVLASEETPLAASTGPDGVLGTIDDVYRPAPRREGDTEAKAAEAVIEALSKQGVTDRDSIDRAVLADKLKREAERKERRQKLLDARMARMNESRAP